MRILAGGVFDILHPGHIFFLKKAAELGEELVVVVATDQTAEKNKGRRPVFSQAERVALVDSLEMVDRAVPGSPDDFFYIIDNQNPDIIALGHDQGLPIPEEKLKGLPAKVVKISEHLEGYSSSALRARMG